MKINLLDARQLAKTLPELFDEHNDIYMSVAWGSNGEAAETLFRNKTKFKSINIGVAFCQTHPDFIDRMVDAPNTYIVNSSGNSVFHPKLYFFVTDNETEAIIGSSNFTNGGLSTNTETNVHIKGKIGDDVFAQMLETFEGLSSVQKSVTWDFAEVYRAKWRAARRYKRPPHPSTDVSAKQAKQFTSDLVRMPWEAYLKAVKSNPALDMRLSVLREVQKLFVGVSSFGDIGEFERKAIAGFIGDKQKKEAGLDSFDWGYFGAMRGTGDFMNRVNENNPHLVKALDSIPPHGDVDKEHYSAFYKHFKKAFTGASHQPTHRSASRLLAMKRPDVFVCVCGPNEDGIANAIGCAVSRIDLETYWDLIVEPIRASKWYNVDRPKDAEDAAMWDYRVAMLDAIYYDP